MLDFGLAKPLAAAAQADAATMGVAPATELGIVVGTVAYMSPEQAQGKPIGDRSDIFSFGAVLYEMLAGRKPFAGDSRSSPSPHPHADPLPIGSIRSEVPPALEALVAACLEKRRPAAGRPRGRRPPESDAGTVDGGAPRRARAGPPARGGERGCRRRGRRRRARLVVVVGERARPLGANGGLPEIRRLSERDDMDGAYRLATEARAVLPDDQELADCGTS